MYAKHEVKQLVNLEQFNEFLWKEETRQEFPYEKVVHFFKNLTIEEQQKAIESLVLYVDTHQESNFKTLVMTDLLTDLACLTSSLADYIFSNTSCLNLFVEDIDNFSTYLLHLCEHQTAFCYQICATQSTFNGIKTQQLKQLISSIESSNDKILESSSRNIHSQLLSFFDKLSDEKKSTASAQQMLDGFGSRNLLKLITGDDGKNNYSILCQSQTVVTILMNSHKEKDLPNLPILKTPSYLIPPADGSSPITNRLVPKDVLEKIASQLNYDDLKALRQTCSLFFNYQGLKQLQQQKSPLFNFSIIVNSLQTFLSYQGTFFGCGDSWTPAENRQKTFTPITNKAIEKAGGTKQIITIQNKPSNRKRLVRSWGTSTLILTHNGTLFDFGLKEYGVVIDNEALKRAGGVKKVFPGFDYIMALGYDGTLFTCGDRNQHGQLDMVTVKYDAIQEAGVKMVYPCCNHTLVLTNNKMPYVHDRNDYGQNVSTINNNALQQALGMADVQHIVLNRTYTLLLCNRTLWGCGNNNSSWRFLSSILAFVPINDEVFQKAGGVEHFAVGDWHIVVVCGDGTVFVSGNNESGQLGNGSFSNQYKFVAVNNEAIKAIQETGSVVKKVCAQGNVTMLLFNNGALLVCGENSNGQLGLGHTSNQSTFVKLANDIEEVATSGSHTLILTRKGVLLVCGANNYGQLGLGDLKNRKQLTLCLPSLQRLIQPPSIFDPISQYYNSFFTQPDQDNASELGKKTMTVQK